MIELDPLGKKPLYEQLYQQLAEQIHNGIQKPGDKLPGRRSMAASLGISVSTVDTAYQLLAAEGLVQSRSRSGFYVQDTQGLLHQPKRMEPVLTRTENTPYLYDLSTGSVDTSLFPFHTWAKIQKELLYTHHELLNRGAMQGDENLRIQIARYLNSERGVQCHADQIVIGAGIEYLLGCLASLFKGSCCAIENPGYHRTRVVLENNGIPCKLVDIDQYGLPADDLEDVDLCYITPSHHFPTGISMPAARRAQLLEWAQKNPQRYIIEDDYDSEFRFDLRPISSLQGMANHHEHVIYLTTFSKSLAPSIRLACMVLPNSLLTQYQKTYAVYANTVSRFEQQTLCQFIEQGYFSRHISRMRHSYRKRKDAFYQSLKQAFGDDLQITGQHTGLHFLLTYPNAGSEAAMILKAQKQGVHLKGLSEYYMNRHSLCPTQTVVAGYAALTTDDIEEVTKRLKLAWK